MWSETSFTRQLDVRYPIVQAPMTDGLGTPDLAAAVSEAGGLGSLAAGSMTRSALARQVRALRALTRRPFNLNLFVPEPVLTPLAPQLRKAHALLRPLRDELGLPPVADASAPPPATESEFEGQVEAAIELKAPVVSFAYGLPPRAIIDRLHEEGTRVMATVTNVDEARDAAALGVDALVAQGAEAGGHRGGWSDRVAPPMTGTFVLVPQVVDAVGPDVPVLAAGGVMDGRGIAAALALGAAGVQMGTAFLTVNECAAPEAYKRAVLEARPGSTVVTRAFSGKPARALATPVALRLAGHDYELPAYPLQHALMRDILDQAKRQGRVDLLPQLAGEGAPMAREMPARELLDRLVTETDAVVGRVAR